MHACSLSSKDNQENHLDDRRPVIGNPRQEMEWFRWKDVEQSGTAISEIKSDSGGVAKRCEQNRETKPSISTWGHRQK